MNRQSQLDERSRLTAEIEALQRWADDLMRYLEVGLQDREVSQEEFSNAATMAARVLMRLKALYDRANAVERVQAMREDRKSQAGRLEKKLVSQRPNNIRI